MGTVFRKVLHRLGLRYSPSATAEDLGRELISRMAAGAEQSAARRAELLASGMTPEEAQSALLRELVLDPGFPVMLAHAGAVAKRSFPVLYEDDEENVG